MYRREIRSTAAKSVRDIIKDTSRFHVCLYNSYFNTIFVFGLNGARAIGFKDIYEPKDGLIMKGSGKYVMQEIQASFTFHSQDRKYSHFRFNYDGTLFHFIRSTTKAAYVKEYLTSVNVYQGRLLQ